MNRVYPTLVVSTMSSGKSTLINALVGTELLPSMNRACTARAVAIMDNDLKTQFEIHAADKNGNYSHIDKATKKVLDEYPEGLILYVINAQQIGTYDDSYFLSLVARKLEENSHFNILFVVNKMDLIDPQKEDPQELICNCKNYIESKGIKEPIIIPVSASSALLFKKALDGEGLSEIEEENFLRNYKHFKRDGYSLQDYICVTKRGNPTDEVIVDEIKYSRAQIYAALENTGLPFLEKQIDEMLVSSLKMTAPRITIKRSNSKPGNQRNKVVTKRGKNKSNKRKRG